MVGGRIRVGFRKCWAPIRSLGRKFWKLVISEPVALCSPWIGALIATWAGSQYDGFWVPLLVMLGVLAVSLIPLVGNQRAKRSRPDVTDIDGARALVALRAVRWGVADVVDLEQDTLPIRAQRATQLIADLLNTIVSQIFQGADGIRATYYAVNDDRTGLTMFSQAGRRQRGLFNGRDFDADHPATYFALARLNGATVQSVPDVSKAPAEWQVTGHSYASFVCLPVRSSKTAFGLLSVDSPRVDQFSDADGEALVPLATALALYAAVKDRGRRRGPTTAREGQEDDGVNPVEPGVTQ